MPWLYTRCLPFLLQRRRRRRRRVTRSKGEKSSGNGFCDATHAVAPCIIPGFKIWDHSLWRGIEKEGFRLKGKKTVIKKLNGGKIRFLFSNYRIK